MNAEPLRVLHIIDTFSMGGVETWLIEILRHLRHTGANIQMDILATSGNCGIFDDEAQALGARIIYLPYRRSSIVTFFKTFRRLLRQGRYDVVHDHQGYASGWHFLMGLGVAPGHRVAHFHNRRQTLYYRSLSTRIVALVGRALTVRTASAIAGASEQLLDEYGLSGRKRRPARPLYCGFNPQRFVGERPEIRRSVREEFGWPANARLILHAGRSDAASGARDVRNVKNTDFAMDVAIACAQRDPMAHVIFAGETNATLDQRQAILSRAGVAGRVKFIGVRRDIERLMLACDAFFLPSRCEGLGMVAVEAQAAGLPVIVSTGTPRDCIVAPDLIQFRSLEEGPQAWAAEILSLVLHDRLRSRAKEISASRFAIEKSVRALFALYRYETSAGPAAHRVQVLDTGGATA